MKEMKMGVGEIKSEAFRRRVEWRLQLLQAKDLEMGGELEHN